MSTMTEVVILAYIVVCLLPESATHAGHEEVSHPFLSRSMAMSFIPKAHWIHRRTASSCQNDEGYCEKNKMECMTYVESNREHFCKPDPCSSGSTCYLSTPCPAHFTQGCTENACLGLPCEHGATCSRQPGSNFTCLCTSGFYGDTCEYVDACHSVPCVNGGTCDRDANSFNCACTNRYQGTTCEIDCRPGPADILFIIDASLSTEKHFNDSKATVTAIINKLPIGADDFQIAVMKYSFDATMEFSFSTYTDKADLVSAIDNISPIMGPSYLDKALDKAKEVFGISSSFGARAQVFQYLIIVSDGLSTLRTEAVKDAQTLKNRGIKVLTVGNGEQVDQTELLQLATASQYVFSGGKEDDTTNVILIETVNTSCTDCLLNTMTDMVFVVDISKHQTVLQQTLDALKDLIYKALDYNPNTQVGMVTFDLTATLKFNLNQYTDRDKILLNSQIGLATTNQKSNITAALTFVRENGFNSNRPNSRKMLVVFSNKGWTDVDGILRERQALNMDNVLVVFVSVGRSADLVTVYTVAERVSDVYFIEQDADLVRFNALVAQTTHVECPFDIFDIRK
ncbi:collagen alpha-5(VI) chain-like [Mizuhopecten yessoensis]|uniref:Collagen alpha-5(VI) chain n=1 Tax=Mizuhopecten yessoensis TaxID=6573 RepID=A0A210PHF8_MIZYE|nr:collagen alpha-5(VI) chain-like [Mizuhopecten yessoensis]XP_021341571.1 collagen alpha-5(VI) chain-like [Mizuhopecten yessoensis]OWF35921.1 Collagen alpha-5(VI) chain [Mizuhopecten yessoensis]